MPSLQSSAWGSIFFTYNYDREDRDHGRLVQFVNATIHPNDVVYLEPTAFLEAIGIAREAYMPTADWDIVARMSSEQRNSINVLLVHENSADYAISEFCGNWKWTGEELKS